MSDISVGYYSQDWYCPYIAYYIYVGYYPNDGHSQEFSIDPHQNIGQYVI